MMLSGRRQITHVFSRVMLLTLLIPMSMVSEGEGETESHEVGARKTGVIFYLHGKIIEDEGPNAESDRYGRYEYEAILDALGSKGHRVISEARKSETNPWEYAKKIATEITELKRTGVHSEKITVVGASKGAAIAILISHLLGDPKINYVLLAICGPEMLEFWEAQDICVTGNILSIHEMSDELAGSCEALAARCSTSVVSYNEIALELDVGHGMVYRPHVEWVTPTLEWSMSGQAVQQTESEGGTQPE